MSRGDGRVLTRFSRKSLSWNCSWRRELWWLHQIVGAANLISVGLSHATAPVKKVDKLANHFKGFGGVGCHGRTFSKRVTSMTTDEAWSVLVESWIIDIVSNLHCSPAHQFESLIFTGIFRVKLD